MKTTLDSESSINAKTRRGKGAMIPKSLLRINREPRELRERRKPERGFVFFQGLSVFACFAYFAVSTAAFRKRGARRGAWAWNSLRTAVLAALLAAGGWPCAGQTTLQINQVGHWPAYTKGGEATSVTVSSNLAYVSTPGGLYILDVSSPPRCTFVAQCKVSGGYVFNAAVQGTYAYLVGQYATDIFDVRDPSQPVRVGSYGSGGRRVAVQGNYAYVMTAYQGTLTILNVANPANPVRLGSYTPTTFGYGKDMAVSGNYVYLAHDKAGLEVINVANPSNPVRVGAYQIAGSGEARDVAVSGNYVYAHFFGGGTEVLLVSNPANPVRLSGGLPGGDLAVAGSYLHVPGTVIDVSDPANPLVLGSYSINTAWGVAAAGDFAFVAGYYGFHLIDVSDASSPVVVGGFDGRAGIAAVQGLHVFTTDNYGFHVLDVSNPVSPRQVGEWSSAEYGSAGPSVLCGNHLYTSVSAGLRVTEVSDPTAPSCVSAIASGFTSGSPDGIAAAGDHLCLTKGSEGLRVFDISNPTNPVYRGSYDSPGYAYGVTIVSNYAYLADGGSGLHVVNLNNPSSPVRVAGYDTPGTARGVAVSSNYVYVADGYVGGLQVIRFTPPSSCVRVGSCLLWDAQDVVVVGPYAYVTVGDEGVEVLDVSDPTKPVSIGRCANGKSGGGLWVDGNSVYVQREGVDILRTDAHPRLLPETLECLPDGRQQFRVSGAVGQALEIQSSSDFVQWNVVGGLTNTSGQEWFTEPVAEPSPRFYRARVIR